MRRKTKIYKHEKWFWKHKKRNKNTIKPCIILLVPTPARAKLEKWFHEWKGRRLVLLTSNTSVEHQGEDRVMRWTLIRERKLSRLIRKEDTRRFADELFSFQTTSWEKISTWIWSFRTSSLVSQLAALWSPTLTWRKVSDKSRITINKIGFLILVQLLVTLKYSLSAYLRSQCAHCSIYWSKLMKKHSNMESSLHLCFVSASFFSCSIFSFKI